MKESRRAIILLLDSVGCGEAPDAEQYGDSGSNTLGNICRRVGGLNLPNLAALGLGRIGDFMGIEPVAAPAAAFGKLREISVGKDTTCGHWELAGTPVLTALPTYPHGFPSELIASFEQAIGRQTLGNEVASGTEIIARLGTEHMKSGKPIVYTSADSVFQIAAHEEVIPLAELYHMCELARGLLVGEHGVGRVIARPFVGTPDSFTRTANRRDYSLQPPDDNIFLLAQQSGLDTVAIGKIHDIFAERGISHSYPTIDNHDGMAQLLAALDKHDNGLFWANLVDFDMCYGHRNDACGYAAALEQLDAWLPDLLAALRPSDLLFITADHGNDPTTSSTDHSREYVPLLVYGKTLPGGRDLGIRSTFADVGATIAEYLQTAPPPYGSSFLHELN